ncbi:hypothetical protein IE53DRAFT_314879 [Violaceomyces palustris]|uniref:Uncharacterized protein n=1 Tax=Violaceomyces palustris TaxID=1673888 RepID=A0ACD0NZ16_9BASI|nr:hypothetical protein IE53DRAFT_314879 [Violaceomyces palustris]
MSPDEFRAGFGESWQLSQFWYSTTFANRLSRCIREELESLRREEGIPNPKLGFLSCPTGYVSYLHLYPDSFRNVHLFEYDTRFSLLSGTNFTRYDLNRPLDFNDSQRFRGSFDLIVVDPPFLNEVTNRSMGETVKFLLKQGTPTQTTNRGKVILITGRSISEFACSVGVYDDLKPLTPFPLHVQHASGLANDFAIWGNWQGVDRFR